MDINKIVVTISGLAGIAFVAWFFFGKREEKVSNATGNSSDTIDITVSGGYSPSKIFLQKGKKTTINFLRTDPSSCLEEVVVSDFKIRKFLPLKQKVSIEITSQKSGEFPFSCGMGMYSGKIVVRE